MPPLNLPWLGRPPKLLIPFLAAVGGVGAVLLIFAGQQQIKGLQRQLVLSHQQLAKLEQVNQELTGRLENLEGERKDLDRRLTSFREQLTAATTELEQSKTALKEVEERYAKLSDERTQLQGRMEVLAAQREASTQEIRRLEGENEGLQQAASRVRERFALLDRDYRALSEKMAAFEDAQRVTVTGAPNPLGMSASSAGGDPADLTGERGIVELPPIVVRSDQAGTSLPVRGRIIEVNTDHHFVVVDRGSQDGVRAGMVLNILRGGATVGRVSVIRVRPGLAACDVIRSSTPGPLQMGDLVVQGGS